MNAEETEIYEFLKRTPHLFVSVTEISRKVGQRKRFIEDRQWTRPILRRMEVDGLVESNEFGEYRVRKRPEDTTSFWKAIQQPDPNIALADTAIITLDEPDDAEKPQT
jgi:hypothetical protein